MASPKCSRLSAGQGFTLAELLIALAILGVIATFTIPKVLQAQQNSTKKSIILETLSAISSAMEEGRLTGQLSDNSLAYFGQKLNAVKICSNDSSTEGCWDTVSQGTGAGQNTTSGIVLHNGAQIISINKSTVLVPSTAHCDDFYIDWNGPLPPNQANDDQFYIFLSWGTTPGNQAGGTWPWCQTIRPGTVSVLNATMENFLYQ